MVDTKINAAVRELRKSLGLTQPQFAKETGMSGPSVAHFETGDRNPDAGSMALLCRAAFKAGRLDLADVFAAAIPGVAEGLLIPRWKTVQPEPEPEIAEAERPQTVVPDRWSQQRPLKISVPVKRASEARTVTVQVQVGKGPARGKPPAE